MLQPLCADTCGPLQRQGTNGWHDHLYAVACHAVRKRCSRLLRCMSMRCIVVRSGYATQVFDFPNSPYN